jgi:hypothetical protein
MTGFIEKILAPSSAEPQPLPGGSMQPPKKGGGRTGLAMLEPEPGDGAEQKPLMPRSSRFGISSVVSRMGSGLSGLRDLVLRRKS